MQMTGQILPFAQKCLGGWMSRRKWEMVLLWTCLHSYS